MITVEYKPGYGAGEHLLGRLSYDLPDDDASVTVRLDRRPDADGIAVRIYDGPDWVGSFLALPRDQAVALHQLLGEVLAAADEAGW